MYKVAKSLERIHVNKEYMSTGLIGIALNEEPLQYTIVSSPMIITPPKGNGTGISRPAPLSRLFCDHGPSIKSLSLSATSYVLR